MRRHVRRRHVELTTAPKAPALLTTNRTVTYIESPQFNSTSVHYIKYGLKGIILNAHHSCKLRGDGIFIRVLHGVITRSRKERSKGSEAQSITFVVEGNRTALPLSLHFRARYFVFYPRTGMQLAFGLYLQ